MVLLVTHSVLFIHNHDTSDTPLGGLVNLSKMTRGFNHTTFYVSCNVSTHVNLFTFLIRRRQEVKTGSTNNKPVTRFERSIGLRNSSLLRNTFSCWHFFSYYSSLRLTCPNQLLWNFSFTYARYWLVYW